MPLLLLRGHSDVVEDEGVDVGVFVDYLRHRFSGAVAGLALDTYELGSVAGIGSLKRGGVLE